MSVPELRVVDTPIYDDMIIEQMEADDDVPRCSRCHALACSRIICTRCRVQRLACPKCEAHILALIRTGNDVECLACHASGPGVDLIKVVSL